MTNSNKSLEPNVNNYSYQPIVTETLTDSSGTQHTIVNPNRLENFKSVVEGHLATLTYEVQTLKQHASWIEPRLNDYHKFMEWMQRVHPDVIDAYKKSTAVAEALDRANDEMIYPQSEAAA